VWGDAAGSSNPPAPPNRNTGGALGADRVQTETKNIYVWFKLPDTSLDFTVGLQSQSDDYAGVLYGGADMAGIFMNGKYEPVAYKLGWAKLYENQVQKSNDQTLHYSSVTFKPMKDATLGVNFYYFQDDTMKEFATGILPGTNLPPYPGSLKVYMPGIDGTFKAGPVTLTGFFQYQTGTYKARNSGDSDIDVDAYLADLRAEMNLGPGKAFLEGLYLSGGDNPGDKYKAPISLATHEASPGGNSGYSRTNMAILLASPDTINVSQCLIGCSGGESGSDLGNRGRGLWHVAGGYAMPLTKQLKVSANVGYIAAVKLTQEDNANGVKDKDMGTEFNARIDYNIMKGLDVGAVGAYAIIGDFYNFNSSPPSDVKDAWTSYARINYSF